MLQNYWAVVCDESEAPGLWNVWLKERCVAIGWSPSKHHSVGPTHDSSWQKARSRAQKIKPGDIVIPYLKDYRFGIPGKVLKVAIRDAEWHPTIPKGQYGDYPAEARLGRRIVVKWLRGQFPPFRKIAVVPENLRTGGGEVQQTVERVRRKRLSRFIRIIKDAKNWKPYLPSSAAGKPANRKHQQHSTKSKQKLSATGAALSGGALFLKRARQAFPVLVRQALSRQKIFYSELSDELRMANPRNLNYVLGAIGKTIKELSVEWQQEIPPLQCIVVNKATGLPGEGVAWFISDLKDFKQRTPEERKQILGVELVKVFSYTKWEKVLSAVGLKPITRNPMVDTLIARARAWRGVGECEDHRRLKEYVANNPKVIGLSGFGKGEIEYCFPTQDRIDVVFRKHDRWVGVEVKGPSSPDEDLVRGLFQTVKYAALREAELKSKSQKGRTAAILVLSRKLPAHLKELKHLLGVTVVDGIPTPDPSQSR